MKLENIVKKLTVPLVVGTMAFGSLGCENIFGNSDEEENISHRQEVITKPGSNSNSPQIRYTFVPVIGSYSNVKGKTNNADPSTMSVTAYVHAAGGWWVKPYYAQRLTKIKSDGTFEFDYTTGGVDQNADRINAYIITNDYFPPGNSLPDIINNEKVLAGVTIYRE